MSTFLVTGAAGFIGSNLVGKLVRDGHVVKTIDNYSTGRMENLEPFMDDIEFVLGDCCEKDLCRSMMKGVDYVLHHAALGSVPRSIDDPFSSVYNNIISTITLLVAARDERVKRFIFASSASVYGNKGKSSPIEYIRGEPINPYAVTKQCGEDLCKIFYELYGMPNIILRYYNVFGPKQNTNSSYSAVIPRMISKMLKDESPIIYGTGEQVRDFTFVENVISANLKACYHDFPIGIGEAYNIGCGKPISINALFAYLKEIIGFDGQAIHEEARRGEILASVADSAKADRILDWRSSVDVFTGLKKTVEWYRVNKCQT